MTHLTDEQINLCLKVLREGRSLNEYEFSSLSVQWEIVRALTRIANALEDNRAG